MKNMFPGAFVEFDPNKKNLFRMRDGYEQKHWPELKEYFDSKKKYHCFFEVKILLFLFLFFFKYVTLFGRSCM